MSWRAEFWTDLLNIDSDFWQICVALGTFSAVAASVIFGIREGIAARRDRRELVELRKATSAKERIAVASLVSAWIVDTFASESDRHSYRRTITLHIANESSEPVFNSTAVMYLDIKSRLIGPLSTPSPIPVIPPRRELVWDITTGVQAFEENSEVRVELGFSDASSRRWLRGLDGALSESTGKDVFHYQEQDPERAEQQLGYPDTYRNPMTLARYFTTLLWADPKDFDLAVFRTLLDQEAVGWQGDWDDERVQELRDLLSKYGNLAALAWYASPKVAYARIFADSALKQSSKAGVGLPIDGLFITLVHHNQHGWLVFGIGRKYRPDEIKFPDGEFVDD